MMRRQHHGVHAFSQSVLVLLVTILAFYSKIISAAPLDLPDMKNVTINVPNGTRYLVEENVLCVPSTWKSISLYFLFNYVLHMFTVKALPGHPSGATTFWAFLSLLLPTCGMVTGLRAIFARAIFSSRSLDAASRSGALCEVVRTSAWRPQDGDVIEGAYIRGKVPNITNGPDGPIREVDEAGPNDKSAFQSPSTTSPDFGPSAPSSSVTLSTQPQYRQQLDNLRVGWMSSEEKFASFLPAKGKWSMWKRTVHGKCSLPPGYALAMLPLGTRVNSLPSVHPSPSEYNGNGDVSEEVKHESNNNDTTNDRNNKNGITGRTVCRGQYLHSLVHALRKTRKTPTIDSNLSGCMSDEITASHSLGKNVAAIVQIVATAYTLYQIKGDQFERFGWTAFGLTVVPYLLMALINLLGNLLTPNYEAMYLVSSNVSDEAAKRPGGRFEGMVARVEHAPEKHDIQLAFKVDSTTKQTSMCITSEPYISQFDWQSLPAWSDRDYHLPTVTESDTRPDSVEIAIPRSNKEGNPKLSPFNHSHLLRWRLLCTLVLDSPMIIIWGFICLESEDYDSYQTYSIMIWLSLIVCWSVCPEIQRYGEAEYPADRPLQSRLYAFELFLFIGGAVTLNAYVAIGQMLAEFGDCHDI